ncbi:Leucine-rich repeat-containing protein 57 [Nosema granulosis]|uniref:Leucine-rich repeat-containing protein 57 n=1 Tax=Nosema granulosis TaxID=83296 RepID=A0A9P6KZD3_9MICR|nr:Leucine-rich repeat-containing protein 57 [Nosema granulosis]
MGASQSIPVGKIYIGKSNVSAPGVLRLYNLTDTVFPYRRSDFVGRYSHIRLDTKMAKVEAKMRPSMNLSPRDSNITFEEEEIYNNIYRKELTARKIIMNGSRTHNIFYDPIEDKNQIYLCRQFVVELDEEIGKIKDLKVLQACCNYISFIPNSIGMLKNLKVLILSRNRIRKIPDEIGGLVNLREINLSHNFIEELPTSMVSLKLLNALHIENNRLKKIPNFVVNLQSLKYLNISNNPISEIPFRIFKLPFLIEILAEGCPLKFEETIEKVENVSLKEICCRHLLRNNLPVYTRTDVPLARYLFSVEECCFCGGPLFDSYYLMKTKHSFEGKLYPVVYKMCESHYSYHKERLESLYKNSHKTFPFKLIVKDMTSISELFNTQKSFYSMYDNLIVRTSKMSLTTLSKFERLPKINIKNPNVLSDDDDEQYTTHVEL